MLNTSPDSQLSDIRENEAFRQAMRGWASTVAVVSSAENGTPSGIVASAVISVSMEPPSLLVAMNRSSSCHALFLRRQAFTVSFLSNSQSKYAQEFHRRKSEDRFSGREWAFSDADGTAIQKLPFLTAAQANIFCWVEEAIEAHTHTLFIGRVAAVRLCSAIDPLLYCDGQYRSEEHTSELQSRT